MPIGLIGIEILIVTFVLTVTFTKILLPLLQHKHAGQYILEIGPTWHKNKEGTPTMGGLAPLAAVFLCASLFLLFFSRTDEAANLAPVIITLLFAFGNGLVGVFDDATKLINKKNGGFTPWQKLVLQTALATAYICLLVRYGIISATISIPFFNIVVSPGPIWYPLAVVFLVWFVNCANLTDGIDGLASSVGGVVAIGFMLIGLYLASFSLVFCSACFLGSTLGFFIFNRHPARIFMGDTGSLFFGAIAVGCAFISGNPLLMLPLGIVFSLEGISVILQVGYYKISHGKRLFLMAPFHHHLEKKGWSEWKIVIVFSAITLIAVSIAFAGVI